MYNALENCLAYGRGTAFKLYCKTKTKLNQNRQKNVIKVYYCIVFLYKYIYIFASPDHERKTVF